MGIVNQEIGQLQIAYTISSSDQMVIWSTVDGYSKRASISTLLSTIQQNSSAQQFVTQYSVPSATGFTINVNDSNDSTWLIISPLGAYAAGTIILPSVDNCVDQQEILVVCTLAVAALTVNGNGAIAVNGAPTALSANAFFRLKYNLASKIWWRVG